MSRRASSDNLLKLSKASIAGFTLAPGQADRTWWDTEVRGLGYRLRQSGNAVWVIRPPRLGGPSRIFTLGSAKVLTLTDARAAARERIAKAQLGDDLHAARRQAREQAVATLGSFVAAYVADAERRLRPATISGLKTHMHVHWKPLHTHPVGGLKRADVSARLIEITTKHGPHAANRARAVLSGFYSWLIGRGLAETNPVIGSNKPTNEVARERVLSDLELATIWRACGDDDFSRIVKLLILTGQRRGEVAGIAWSEIDTTRALWTLPAERSKNHRAHDVPLSATALEILAGVERMERRDTVFGRGDGGFKGSGHAKARLDLATASVGVGWRIHDLRRTTATGMANLGVLPHVVEAVLNHVSGSRSGVAGIYNRATYASEKRAALDLWAAHVRTLVTAP